MAWCLVIAKAPRLYLLQKSDNTLAWDAACNKFEST